MGASTPSVLIAIGNGIKPPCSSRKLRAAARVTSASRSKSSCTSSDASSRQSVIPLRSQFSIDGRRRPLRDVRRAVDYGGNRLIRGFHNRDNLVEAVSEQGAQHGKNRELLRPVLIDVEKD